MLQGTYLPAAVAEELHAMQLHGELLEAMGQLQALYVAAQAFRQRTAARAVSRLPRQVELLPRAVAVLSPPSLLRMPHSRCKHARELCSQRSCQLTCVLVLLCDVLCCAALCCARGTASWHCLLTT